MDKPKLKRLPKDEDRDKWFVQWPKGHWVILRLDPAWGRDHYWKEMRYLVERANNLRLKVAVK